MAKARKKARKAVAKRPAKKVKVARRAKAPAKKRPVKAKARKQPAKKASGGVAGAVQAVVSAIKESASLRTKLEGHNTFED